MNLRERMGYEYKREVEDKKGKEKNYIIIISNF